MSGVGVVWCEGEKVSFMCLRTVYMTPGPERLNFGTVRSAGELNLSELGDIYACQQENYTAAETH